MYVRVAEQISERVTDLLETTGRMTLSPITRLCADHTA